MLLFFFLLPLSVILGFAVKISVHFKVKLFFKQAQEAFFSSAFLHHNVKGFLLLLRVVFRLFSQYFLKTFVVVVRNVQK